MMAKHSSPNSGSSWIKQLFARFQEGRKVSRVLRGYNLFLNLVLDACLEETTGKQCYIDGNTQGYSTVVIHTAMKSHRKVLCWTWVSLLTSFRVGWSETYVRDRMAIQRILRL